MNVNPTYVPVSRDAHDRHIPAHDRPERAFNKRTNVSLVELFEAGFNLRACHSGNEMPGDGFIDYDDGSVRLTGPDGMPYWYITETHDGILEGYLL